jgi:hypothetical protein
VYQVTSQPVCCIWFPIFKNDQLTDRTGVTNTFLQKKEETKKQRNKQVKHMRYEIHANTL